MEDIQLTSYEGLEKIPTEIKEKGVMEIVKYILHLVKSRNAKPLYRTKLMVAGYMNVGKTTLIDNLFPIKSIVSVNTGFFDFHPKDKEIALQGKRLILSNKELTESYNIDNSWVINKTSHLSLHLSKKSSPQKDLKLNFQNEDKLSVWYQRLKRSIRNESTHGIDISREIVDHPIVTKTMQNKKTQKHKNRKTEKQKNKTKNKKTKQKNKKIKNQKNKTKQNKTKQKRMR